MTDVRMRQEFAAAPEKVFAAVTDHRSMWKWLDGVHVSIDEPGDPPPNGLGAVRRIRARGLTISEKVVRWEPPQAMDYRLIRGAPIRDHLGEIRLTPTARGGTLLEYRISFTVPWYFGGPVLARLIGRQLEAQISRGLAKLAAQLGSG